MYEYEIKLSCEFSLNEWWLECQLFVIVFVMLEWVDLRNIWIDLTIYFENPEKMQRWKQDENETENNVNG